jgi:cobaltochelatase CobS
VARIAFDSAIDRSELVGRMQLKSDGQGGTVSEWLKGVLELAIPNGYWLLCDEFDAGRPDALYVLQEILEHKAKRLLEDGGRFIDYHPMTRVIATGNTCGSGDPSGIYPATRILSGATLDRYPVFIHVPYMTNAEEENLISQNVTLAKPMIKRMAKFATEMRQAFIKAEIPISYSPRRSVSFARATEDFLGVLGHNNMDKAMSLALQQAVYDAAPEEFKQRIVEIARSALGATIDPTTTI